MIGIRILRAGDELVLENVAPGVFDDSINKEATLEFLGDPRHHLAVAIEDELVVGFASAVEYVHPDKSRPELWVNEVAVASSHRRRGAARKLLEALLDEGRGAGCIEAWVLTERSNTGAMRLYGSVGGQEASSDQVMFTFFLDPAPKDG